MGKIEKTAIVVLISLMLILLAAATFGYFNTSDTDTIWTISVIVNDVNDDYWKNFKMGMDKAAADYGVDVTFVTLYNNNSVAQQMELLERGIDSGVQAVVLCPAADEELDAALSDMNIDIPIVTVGSSLESGKIISHIGPDDTAIGSAMGDALLEDGIKDIVIYAGDIYTYSMEERVQALIKVCDEGGINYNICRSELANAVTRYTEAVVAMDESLIDELSESQFNKRYYSLKLYGIGYTSRTLSYMESSYIEKLIVYNRYDEGYLSLEQAVYAIQQKDRETTVLPYFLIDQENIYDKEYQKLLIPIS